MKWIVVLILGIVALGILQNIYVIHTFCGGDKAITCLQEKE